MGRRLVFALESKAITNLITDVKTVEYGGLDLQPYFQRNFVWKKDFKDKLIYSIIKDYPIGSIIIRVRKQPNEKGAMSEIVDGQQRMTTIYEFMEDKYQIHSEMSRKIIEEVQNFYGEKSAPEFEKLRKKLSNKGKITLKYSDLPSVIRGRFEGFNISVTKILESEDSDITEYFRFLQNQERLRAGEILNSLIDSKMDKYLNRIQDIDEFCHIIGFDNGRKEFDKLFYNIIGVMDNKISFGVPDSVINKYVTNVDKVDHGEKELERLLMQINRITELYHDTAILNNIKKRLVKFMMLLMGFNLVDFTVNTEEKLKILANLDNKLSIFFSTIPNIVEREFKSYSIEVIEEFRAIALISKGAQTLERVKNRMKILAYYIDNSDEMQKASGIPMK